MLMKAHAMIGGVTVHLNSAPSTLVLRALFWTALARCALPKHTDYSHAYCHYCSILTCALLRYTSTMLHCTNYDVNSGLTAAYCHDLDHPGNNNTFEVNSTSALALLHSDDAVLERHHVHMTFKILLEVCMYAVPPLLQLLLCCCGMCAHMHTRLSHCSTGARQRSRCYCCTAP
jgi:3'5'-cyclic nucleotide phosphodiesterase